jgi:hypothetical protein
MENFNLLVDLEKYTVKDTKSSILCKDILDLSIMTVSTTYIKKLKKKILYGAYDYILDLSTHKKGNTKENEKLSSKKM